ncbi:MAG: S8 family peptidase [Eubacteriales bacterium]|nr:S8 family peptidase [Eubacteriales bacterium]
MMINKIDPLLYQKIQTQNLNNKPIDCIVYSNNYRLCKHCLDNVCDIDNKVELPFINAFGVKLKPEEISQVARFSHVSYVTSSLKVQTQIDVSKKIIDITTESQYPHDFTCVVIDTGISPTLDLCVPNNRIVEFVDYVNDKNSPYDDNGHGTFVASILAGYGTVSNRKYAGVDSKCRLIGIKALDSNGETGVINILKAMQWVVDNRKKYNIKVVCMSFGSMVLSSNDPLITGAEVLWNNGITVVAAAGNSGPESQTIKSPGASSKIITVGAINDNRKNGKYNEDNFVIADFSSRGPILDNYKPDLVVPGVDIMGGCNYRLTKQHYKTMSGTSVATPIVAGVCCRLLSQNPKLKPNEIKHILLNKTIKIVDDRNAEGYGLLNCSNLIF